MEQKQKQSIENFIKDIRRKSRRLFSSEQKLIIVMEAWETPVFSTPDSINA
jgi:transposase